MSRKFLMVFSVASAVVLNDPIYAHVSSNKQHVSIDTDQQILSNEEKSLLYLSCGYSNLISKNYQDAFEDYHKASAALSNSMDSGMEFLISFGTVVACDNLNLMRDSRQHVLRIRDLIDSAFDGEQEDVRESTPQDNREMINRLTSLANMSASMETQKVLIAFVSEIFPSALTTYSKSSSDSATPSILSCKMNLKAKPCKSFWKKIESLARRISRTWDKVFKIYKEVREIEDDIRDRLTSTPIESV